MFTFSDSKYSQIEWHIPTPSSALVPEKKEFITQVYYMGNCCKTFGIEGAVTFSNIYVAWRTDLFNTS